MRTKLEEKDLTILPFLFDVTKVQSSVQSHPDLHWLDMKIWNFFAKYEEEFDEVKGRKIH